MGDTTKLLREADLLTVIGADTALKRVASTNGGEYAGPCPFCGGEDRFRVWPEQDGGRWWCRQCERSGDAIAYLVKRGDITPQEAGQLRHADNGGRPVGRPTSSSRGEMVDPGPVRPSRSVSPPSTQWQAQARRFVEYCQEQLFGEAGRAGLGWLHGRGLVDDTLRAWGLGWHGQDRWRNPDRWGLDGGKKVWLAAGVVIPWTVEGAIWHVKVRRFGDTGPLIEPGTKYAQVTRGVPTLYGLDFLTGKEVVVICEGELDAVLLWQEAGNLVDVVAIGSKGAKVPLSILVHLAGASNWLVALDGDADVEANKWGDFSARVRRVRPPQGNDVTEYHQAGGDLRAWVSYYLERLDASQASQSAETVAERPDVAAAQARHIEGLEASEAGLEAALAVLEAATGCPDEEAERLLAEWDTLNERYTEAVGLAGEGAGEALPVAPLPHRVGGGIYQGGLL
jgi:DNA primase